MYLGIDLGTSGVKSLIIDDSQKILATASAPLSVQRPADGYSEQAAEDWVSATEQTFQALKVSHPVELAAVKGIGLSGQMHGATLIGSNDKVLHPCILWNDTRSAAQAAQLDTPASRQITGNILFPGFTAPKLSWVQAHEPQLFDKVSKVLLPKDYLRWWLTGEYVSEMSDAAGTGWLDVAARKWSPECLAAGNMTIEQMPSLVEGTAVSGQLRAELASRFGMNSTTVVAGGAGDNAASACGMGTVTPGSAFLSLGTSGVLFAANETYLPNPASAVHTFCHALPATWHQMGVILSATDSLNWFAGITGKTPAELTKGLETQALKTQTADGKNGQNINAPGEVLFLPYLGGERTPHNSATARGSFTGLAHSNGPTELTQAVLEGVSFAFRDNLAALASAGTTLPRVTAIGGGSRSRYWLSLLATVLNVPVDVTEDGDFGAGFGAARLGMVAANKADPLAICTAPPVKETFEPIADLAGAFDAAYERFQSAYVAVNTETD